MTDIVDQELFEAERLYLDFLDTNVKYQDRIKTLILKKGRRLIIDLNDLRTENKERVEKLLKNSFLEVMACQKALKRCIANINPEFSNTHDEFFVGFEGSFGGRQLNPRTLTSQFLGNMVCVEGIVTKTSLVRSKVNHSVHYCPATNKFLERHYTDITSLDPFPSTGAYPTKDEEGNVLETEYGLSLYIASQSLTIQEMPENAPAGQLPRSIEVNVENDLVDSCKAGDRVYVSGQFRCMPVKKGGFTSAQFNDILIANNVYPITHKSTAKFENSDLAQIRKIAKTSNVIELLTRSIAPTIHGHEFIKRAILCQVLGGVERLLLNGSRIRGDINILLLGDPSVAKSQFLRFVLQLARDRAIATTGRGSSGVGLTAAVVVDRDSGEYGLQPGAMVLADRGIVCIDEFDKMSDIDRTAIHEVMEQGRVTIAKAGIHAKLNARCSVLAAANPVYGRYDQYRSPMDNIGLQDSLLSRFDLLFIVLDKYDTELDRTITEFVSRVHTTRTAGEEDGQALPLQTTAVVDYVGPAGVMGGTGGQQGGVGQVFEPTDGFLQGHQQNEKFLTASFLQKYIHTARQMCPKLSPKASEILHAKFCDLRNQEIELARNGATGDNKYRTQPVTPRTMETLIRLATAHAKARLSKVVSERDAEHAADLVSYVMFKEVLKKPKRSKPANESDEDDDITETNDIVIDKPAKKLRAADMDGENKENTEETVTINEADVTEITKLLSQVFVDIHDTSISVPELIKRVKQKSTVFTASQIETVLQQLHDANRVMLFENTAYML